MSIALLCLLFFAFMATDPAAVAPVVAAPIATAPVTTTPVTSTPVIVAPVATTPMTAAPVATAPVTTTPVATMPVATMPVTAAPVATGENHAEPGTDQQTAPPQPLSVALDSAGGFRPLVRIGSVLNNPALEQAVRSGLPLRMHLRVELWREGLFDALERSRTWTAMVAYEPLARQFHVLLPGDSALSLPFGSFDGVRTVLEQEHPFDIAPDRTGRYYYQAHLELETLSLSDIDELGRWLRGELQPAVKGQRSLTEALGQGVRRLLIRLLRLPTGQHQARSRVFLFQ